MYAYKLYNLKLFIYALSIRPQSNQIISKHPFFNFLTSPIFKPWLLYIIIVNANSITNPNPYLFYTPILIKTSQILGILVSIKVI